jgi:hypothetical protein
MNHPSSTTRAHYLARFLEFAVVATLFGCGSGNTASPTNDTSTTSLGGSRTGGGTPGTHVSGGATSMVGGTGGTIDGGSGTAAGGRKGSDAVTGGSTQGGSRASNSLTSSNTTGGIAGGGKGSSGAGIGGRSLSGTAVGGMSVGGAAAGGRSLSGAAVGGSGIGGTATSGGDTGAGASGGKGAGGAMISGGGSGGAAAGSSGGGGSSVAAAISKDGERTMALSGLTIVSYGGYLNGESFQQEGILSYKGYQYTAFWNTNRHVVMARRALPDGDWEKFEFTDYTNTADDAHNTISLGICPGDDTLHLSFDHHSNDLHYRRSKIGFLATPSSSSWSASSFDAVTSVLAGSAVTKVTYPRFVTEPGGSKMLLSARIGESGSGDEYLWEYDATGDPKSDKWVTIGKYINGIVDSVNAYLHGLTYTKRGTPRRLHASWCWRDTSDASTNHDLVYIYSDDDGRTWKNDTGNSIGASGSSPITESSPGIVVRAIKQNRGLINQEHMAVDSMGGVHVLLSHMPDDQADDATFDSARTKSEFFHYHRRSAGTWDRAALGLPVVANFRGKLAISSSDNVYAILPDLRIAAASAPDYSKWSLLDSRDSGRFFSDPLIDSTRLETEDKLTIYYPQKSSVNIWALDYTLR